MNPCHLILALIGVVAIGFSTGFTLGYLQGYQECMSDVRKYREETEDK